MRTIKRLISIICVALCLAYIAFVFFGASSNVISLLAYEPYIYKAAMMFGVSTIVILLSGKDK